jgi:predicted DNA-binding protein with PD1-like motif
MISLHQPGLAPAVNISIFGSVQSTLYRKECQMLQRPFDGGWVIRLETGESVIDTIIEFCEREGIAAGTLSGIGAVTSARLGYYNQDTGKYTEMDFEQELEVISLTGNISRKSDGSLFPHIHCVLSDTDMSVFGGHLFKGLVGPTLEIYMFTVPGEIRRTARTGHSLELLDL